MHEVNAQTVERARRGDLEAVREILENFQTPVFKTVYRMVGRRFAADVEDITQDVFIKALKALKAFRPEASVSTWLYRIAVNTCIDRRRRPLLRWFSFDDDDDVSRAPSDAPSPERLVESQQTSERIQRALKRLSPKLRAAIILKEIENLPYEQIAETLEISKGTVESRLFRARERLREALSDWMDA